MDPANAPLMEQVSTRGTTGTIARCEESAARPNEGPPATGVATPVGAVTPHSPDVHTTDADRRILARLVAADPRAFVLLHARFGARAESIARAALVDPRDAEEVVADAFAQVWRTVARFDATRGTLQSWVLTIVRSRARDRRRARRRAAVVDGGVERSAGLLATVSAPDDAPSPAEEVELAELQATIYTALAELSRAHRSVLELAYFEGLSQSEIAARLGTPLGTVKTRVRAAIAKLRATLGPMRVRGTL